MRIVLSDFISLDGVVQASGGEGEDSDGGFRHGGWSMPYFDPEATGPSVGELLDATDAPLFGRRTWQAMAAVWPERAGDGGVAQVMGKPRCASGGTGYARGP